MIEFAMKYWLEALFVALLGVMSAWYRRQRATERGVQALLRDRLVQAYFHYMERGTITMHGKENTEKMYTEYVKLGGNGMVHDLLADLRKLEVVDK